MAICLSNALVQLQAHYHNCGEAASESACQLQRSLDTTCASSFCGECHPVRDYTDECRRNSDRADRVAERPATFTAGTEGQCAEHDNGIKTRALPEVIGRARFSQPFHAACYDRGKREHQTADQKKTGCSIDVADSTPSVHASLMHREVGNSGGQHQNQR